MQLQKILKNDCFLEAKVVSNHDQLDRDVSSVMILEATDIEKWGSKNQLILTSYYALIDLKEEELYSFFKKMSSLSISGLIIKLHRLVNEVPKTLIDYCNAFDIPLIEIPEEVKYETIILAVLQPIINENSTILNSYYQARKTISQLSFKELSFYDLLKTFKTLLKLDVQFESDSNSIFYTTKLDQKLYTIVSKKILPAMKFVDNQYYEQSIKYSDGQVDTIVSIDIPNILDQKYTFSVFSTYEQLSENDIMLIENVTEYLLTELLKIYAIKKNQSMRKNNQMHDLLLARYYSLEERDSILNVLGIDKYPFYQGVMVSLYGDNLPMDNPIRSALDPAIEFMKTNYPTLAYFQKNHDVVFLINFADETSKIQKDDFKELIDIYQRTYPSLICHVGISSVQDAKLEFINENLLNLKKFMMIVHQKSTIFEYDQLGFFKLFYNIENIDELFNYVPSDLLTLVEEKNEYANTLANFLANNQNYVKTAQQMFVHPKTVRYRIEKVMESLSLSLDDSDTLLSIQVALKICEFAGLIQPIKKSS